MHARSGTGIPAWLLGDTTDFRIDTWLDQALKEHAVEVGRLAATGESSDFQSIISKLDLSGRPLRIATYALRYLVSSHTTKALRSIDREFRAVLGAHYERVYGEVFAHLTTSANLDDLEGEERRLATLTARRCWLSGSTLDRGCKERLLSLSKRHAQLRVDFQNNIAADEATLFDSAFLGEMRGANPPVTQSVRSAAQNVLLYGDDRLLRRRTYARWVQRGLRSNAAVLGEILVLRAELASLYGYRSYAAFAISGAMAGNPGRVLRFLFKVIRSCWGPAQRGLAELRQVALADLAVEAPEPFDIGYYRERMRFSPTPSGNRKSIRLDDAIAGCIIASTLFFGIGIERIEDHHVAGYVFPCFAVRHAGGGEAGTILMDLFARPSKRGGGWVSVLQDHEEAACGVGTGSAAVVVLDLAAQASTEILVSEAETTALFHEFGHALHQVCSRVRYPSLNALRAPADYLELVPLLFERLRWLPEVRRVVGGEWRSNISGWRPGRSSGVERLRQAVMSLVDIKLHSGRPSDEVALLIRRACKLLPRELDLPF
jgi:peptidyl-dipeptidase Dcp